MQFSLVKNMKTHLKVQVVNEEDGQVIRKYCEKCGELLSEEFYNGSNAYQLLGIRDCSHYRWVFVGEYFLDPPQDPETRKIFSESLGKVNADFGKYFLIENK